MDRFGFLASAHRRVVDEFIEVVLDDLAGDVGDVERNVLGVALRQEVETWLAPELLAIHALLLGADGGTLAELPEWLELTSVIIGCREPHVLEQSSRFYTPHLKAQERLGPAIGPVQGAALAIGVEQQHLESIRKCASQVGGDGGFASAPFLVDDGDDRHTSTLPCTEVQIYSGT